MEILVGPDCEGATEGSGSSRGREVRDESSRVMSQRIRTVMPAAITLTVHRGVG